MVNNLIVSVRSNTTNLNITAAVYSASEFSFNFAVKTKFLQYDNGNVNFSQCKVTHVCLHCPKNETYFIIIQ